MRLRTPIATCEPVAPDAFLVHRIAALSDRTALAELDARHGLTLYALAYSVVFDGGTADTVVAAAFREVWRSAASFDPSVQRVRLWLADLTRRAAQQQLRRQVAPAHCAV